MLTKYGYAYGNYSCFCSQCKLPFTGDKRSITCFSCAEEMVDKEHNGLLALMNELREVNAKAVVDELNKRGDTISTYRSNVTMQDGNVLTVSHGDYVEDRNCIYFERVDSENKMLVIPFANINYLTIAKVEG